MTNVYPASAWYAIVIAALDVIRDLLTHENPRCELKRKHRAQEVLRFVCCYWSTISRLFLESLAIGEASAGAQLPALQKRLMQIQRQAK
jgi:hypothetical protein